MDPFIRKCTVLKVVDGDTLDVEIDVGFHMKAVHRIRLLGINTPETKTDTKVAGLAAKDFVISWLAENPGPYYIRTERSDVFGRWLAKFMAMDGRCLNDILLETGHAVPYKA